jgi:hypothetical protein
VVRPPKIYLEKFESLKGIDLNDKQHGLLDDEDDDDDAVEDSSRVVSMIFITNSGQEPSSTALVKWTTWIQF